MKSEFQKELREIGLKIIQESEKKIPDVILLKAKMDDLTVLIELIRRESKQKILSLA